MPRPKGTGGQARELSAEEIRRIDRCLIGTRNEDRNRALLYVGLGTGLRISELCGLTLGDVRHDGKILPEIVLDKHGTKSKKSRSVSVSEQAMQILGDYLSLDRFSGKADDWPLFPSERHPTKPISARQGIRTLGQMFDTAGVANASSHSLRRTHANTLRRNGADLAIIQSQLGHASLSTTAVYLKVDPIEKNRIVRSLSF